MKSNLRYMLLAGASAAMLAACGDDFLDTSSKTESNTETFYVTESDAYRALIGCYDGWRQTSSAPGVGFYLASEVMGAECFGALGNNDGRNYQVIDRFDITQSPADLDIYATDWKNYYAGIFRCNELITREGQIQWRAGSSKHADYIGQARALRALLYFDLVRLFGNVPLLTVSTADNVPQDDPADVFAQIVADLRYAADSIPATTATYDGHITNYAAKALLTRVYLFYRGYYGTDPAGLTQADALQAVEDVIASQRYSLVADYKDLWRPSAGVVADCTWSPKPTLEEFNTLTGTYAGDDNSEILLSMKFTSTQDYNGNNDGNRWLVMTGVRSFDVPPLGKGWGSCTVDPAFFASYATGDTRRDASIADLVAMGCDVVEQQRDQREYTGYTIKKYSPMAFSDGSAACEALEGSSGFQEGQFQDYVIMRYADVLLMAAELGSPNAQRYLDQVRARAFGDGAHSVPATTANILAERRWEFAFESVNYWDLLRQGLDVAAASIAKTVNVLSGSVPDVVVITADNFKAKKGLSQIPSNQIILSDGVLKQNPGW